MVSTKFSCTVESTNSSVGLGFTVKLDNQTMVHSDHVSSPLNVEFDIIDDENEHTLTFELSNKLPQHTILDSNGNIVTDAQLIVNNIKFDSIDCSRIVYSQSKYHHDFNGSHPPIVDEFYGPMGCNGSVILKFYTPTYIWLLEHL